MYPVAVYVLFTSLIDNSATKEYFGSISTNSPGVIESIWIGKLRQRILLSWNNSKIVKTWGFFFSNNKLILLVIEKNYFWSGLTHCT